MAVGEEDGGNGRRGGLSSQCREGAPTSAWTLTARGPQDRVAPAHGAPNSVGAHPTSATFRDITSSELFTLSLCPSVLICEAGILLVTSQ